MAERQAQNLPPQTGIIDFLRRIAAVDDHSFRDAFITDREGLMKLVGLKDSHIQAIHDGSNAAITNAVANEYRGGVSPDYIRTAHAVAPGLDYTFPDENNLPGGVVEVVADLRRSVERLTQQLDQLSQRLQ